MPRKSAENPSGLHAFVARGPRAGTVLFPHRHRDGCYVVSPDKYEVNYLRVSDARELLGWAEKGYHIRMSNPVAGVKASSLIEPASIFRPVRLKSA